MQIGQFQSPAPPGARIENRQPTNVPGLSWRFERQVLGASVLHVGWQYLPALPPYVNQFTRSPVSTYEEPRYRQRREYQWHETVVCELDTVTHAWSEVRRLALNRLSEEALQVGADAVVGVHLARGEHDWAKSTIDYLVSGTAIRLPGSSQQYWPLLSNLSVQDYWRLSSSGYEPAGLIATTAVVFVSASRSTRLQRLGRVRANQELEELSRGFYLARDTVREQLRSQVRSARGHGTVGVALSHTVHKEELQLERSVQTIASPGWHRGRIGLPHYVSRAGETERKGWVITMHGAGTAIRIAENLPQFPPEKVMRLGPK